MNSYWRLKLSFILILQKSGAKSSGSLRSIIYNPRKKHIRKGKVLLLSWSHWSGRFSCSVMSNSLWPHGLQHARLPSPSPTPGASSNSCPSSQWCHPTISSSVVPLSTCLQSFPAPGSFPMSQLFASGGQIIGASASATVLPVNIQGWFPLELTGLISLLVQYLEHNRCSVKYMSTWMN